MQEFSLRNLILSPLLRRRKQPDPDGRIRKSVSLQRMEGQKKALMMAQRIAKSVGSGMPVSVKVYWAQGSVLEIRRFIFHPEQVLRHSSSHPPPQHSPHLPSHHLHPSARSPGIYLALLDRIRALYQGLNIRHVNLCWKDDDGDYVVFSSDDELKVAVNNTTDNTLRIYIREKTASEKEVNAVVDGASTSKPTLELEEAERGGSYCRRNKQRMIPEVVEVNSVNHRGLPLCSECQGEGRGVWYKCTVCSDYFLCSDCENRGLHDRHIMVRSATPR